MKNVMIETLMKEMDVLNVRKKLVTYVMGLHLCALYVGMVISMMMKNVMINFHLMSFLARTAKSINKKLTLRQK